MLSHWQPASQSPIFDTPSTTRLSHRHPQDQVPPRRICYWIGAGSDSYWSTPENWSEDTLPTSLDAVVFDITSTKDVILNLTAPIYQLTITADYTGTITGWHELIVTENAMIAGGIIERSLQVGGNLTIIGGQVNSYLSIQGDFTVAGGSVTWEGGEVRGNTTFHSGILFFSDAYNRYYIFYGDVVQIHTILAGKPAFYFYGQTLQRLSTGLRSIELRDLSNSAQLQIEGRLKVEGFFTNDGTVIIPENTLLDASEAVSYDNQGTIIQKGQILYPSQLTFADSITDCSGNRV
jgi:hypothetical protein